MFMHKKQRIQSTYDNKNLDHLDRVNLMNENDIRKRELADEEISREMLGNGQSMSQNELFSGDMGNRRYVRKHLANKYNRVY